MSERAIVAMFLVAVPAVALFGLAVSAYYTGIFEVFV